MSLRKYIAVGALLVSLCLLCTGCGAEDTAFGDSSDGAEETAPVGALLLAGEGAPQYVVVRSDNASKKESEAAVLVRKALDACGVKTKITTDWEKNPVSEYEIVVGDTLRAASDAGMPLRPHDVGENGWFIKVSDRRIYICGGSPASTVTATEYFIARFLTDADSASVPADYEYVVRQQYALTSVTVGGKDLRQFRIVCEDTAASKNAAAQLQSYFYETAGIWMEIGTERADDSPALILSGSSVKGSGTMSIRCENGDLLMHIEPYEAFPRGFRSFTAQYFDGASGEVKLDKDFRFTADLMETVSYLGFGAKGDGVTNDMPAIIAAHAFANRYGIPVKADAGKTFLIGPSSAAAVIKTDTDFTDAVFRIDDREVPDTQRGKSVFSVEPSAPITNLTTLKSVRKGQTDLGVSLAADSLVILTDASAKRWIRKGVNANEGSEQQEVILVRKDGTVDPSTPILWDYTSITSAQVIPLEGKTLTIKGGTFITVARENIPDFSYFSRGIRITRSHVVVDGMTHRIENEGKKGSPYYGFWQIADCADVTLRRCTFDVPRTFYYVKNGESLSAGTYAITLSRTVGVRLENCIQTADILDEAYSGALGSNHCKNLTVDSCRMTNCDIGHTGAYNPVIRNSTIGRTPVSAIGSGTLLIENSRFYAHAIVNLRPDYGSHWDGDIIIRGCTWTPNRGDPLTKSSYSIITGENTEDHDFGYACTMPHSVTIENLRVEDGKTTSAYKGISLFADIAPHRVSASSEAAAASPIRLTEEVRVSGLETASGKAWFLSPNMYAFRNVRVSTDAE